MDIHTLKEKIESLDLELHKSLISVLIDEYNLLVKNNGENKSDAETTNDLCSSMFNRILKELNKQYKLGTIKYLQNFQPDFHQKINRSYDKLAEIWIAYLDEEADIKDFKRILHQWYKLLLQGIKLYSENQNENNLKNK